MKPLTASSFAILLFALATLSAQDSTTLSVKVEVNLVNVAFVAHDADGALARNLTQDDIEIFEDGVKQDVKFFSRSGDLPLRLALVVDVSDSQHKFNKEHRKDLESFVASSITSRDHALLVCFGNRIRVVSDFTSSASDLMAAFDQFQKGKDRQFTELEPDATREDGTALFDAIYYTAVQKLGPVASERESMILFSDGEDNSSAHDLMDAIEAGQSANSFIYSVRYTDLRHGRLTARNRYGIREMDRLASETGAASFDASKDNVAASLHKVAEELRSIYEVSYITTHPAHDKMFRKIVIRPKQEGLVIRAKPGYYAR